MTRIIVKIESKREILSKCPKSRRLAEVIPYKSIGGALFAHYRKLSPKGRTDN